MDISFIAVLLLTVEKLGGLGVDRILKDRSSIPLNKKKTKKQTGTALLVGLFCLFWKRSFFFQFFLTVCKKKIKKKCMHACNLDNGAGILGKHYFYV